MTVKELIEKLKDYDENLEVFVPRIDSCKFIELDELYEENNALYIS